MSEPIIFSYSIKDQQLADKFLYHVAFQGFSMVPVNIYSSSPDRPGQRRSRIDGSRYEQILDQSEAFIALVTPNYLAEKRCMEDLKNGINKHGSAVIALVLDPDSPDNTPLGFAGEVVDLRNGARLASLHQTFLDIQDSPREDGSEEISLIRISQKYSKQDITRFVNEFAGTPENEFHDLYQKLEGEYLVIESGNKHRDEYKFLVEYRGDYKRDAKSDPEPVLLIENFYDVGDNDVSKALVCNLKGKLLQIPEQRIRGLRFLGEGAIEGPGRFRLFFFVEEGGEHEINLAEARKIS